MAKAPRSYCPQNLALEVIGDKWVLLIIRDMMIEGKRYFREFLQSKEGIASNILSNRLKMLEAEGIIKYQADTAHQQKIRYSLTEKGIDLLPILMANTLWSLKYKPVDPDDAVKAQAILDQGQKGIERMMAQLRTDHI